MDLTTPSITPTYPVLAARYRAALLSVLDLAQMALIAAETAAERAEALARWEAILRASHV